VCTEVGWVALMSFASRGGSMRQGGRRGGRVGGFRS